LWDCGMADERRILPTTPGWEDARRGAGGPGGLLHQLRRRRPGLGRVDRLAAGSSRLHDAAAGLGLPAGRQRRPSY
jgi:hypothetical protein